MPLIENSRFENPWPTWTKPAFGTLLKWKFSTPNNTNLPRDKKVLKKIQISLVTLIDLSSKFICIHLRNLTTHCLFIM